MMKLLIVDDDVFLRDMYAIKFYEAGFSVQSASNAEQALDKINQNQDFDVVLLDMIMPGMNGLELIQEIKENYSQMNACLIVLSNKGQTTDIEAAQKVGANGYIIKAEAIPSDVVEEVNKLVKSKH